MTFSSGEDRSGGEAGGSRSLLGAVIGLTVKFSSGPVEGVMRILRIDDRLKTGASETFLAETGTTDETVIKMVNQEIKLFQMKSPAFVKDNYTMNKTKAQIVPQNILYLNQHSYHCHLSHKNYIAV